MAAKAVITYGLRRGRGGKPRATSLVSAIPLHPEARAKFKLITEWLKAKQFQFGAFHKSILVDTEVFYYKPVALYSIERWI